MYSTVPLAASALCSPSRQIMDAPTVIKPIWDRDEQARMYFRLVENTASTAPSTMVIAPSTRSSMPQSWSPVSTCAVSSRTPKIPALVSTPLSSAEAGAGATGWALGSQICTENRPALAAKPNRMHSAAAHRRPRSMVATASCSSAITSVPVVVYSRNRPISVTRPPSTAMVR